MNSPTQKNSEIQIEKGMTESGKRSWVCGSLIGAGAFGSVNLAVDNETGELFAVKSTECSPRGEVEALENELSILQSISSPRVVRCLGSSWSTSAETGQPVRSIFLEYMPGGSLSDLMAKMGGRLQESLARVYTRGILEGLSFLHRSGIVHCDIKGKNVLVGALGGVKLADFGAAKKWEAESVSEISIKGTPLWMAPEVVRQEEQGPASDVWSLGCTLLEMVTGKAPWGDSSHSTFAALYRIGCSQELPEIPGWLSDDGKDFLRRCLTRCPAERWSTEQLLNHPFVTQQVVVDRTEGEVLLPNKGAAASSEWQDSGELSKILGEIPVQSARSTQLQPQQQPQQRGLVRPKLEVSSACWSDPEDDQSASSSAAASEFPVGKWIVVRSPQGGSSGCSNDAFNLLSDFDSTDNEAVSGEDSESVSIPESDPPRYHSEVSDALNCSSSDRADEDDRLEEQSRGFGFGSEVLEGICCCYRRWRDQVSSGGGGGGGGINHRWRRRRRRRRGIWKRLGWFGSGDLRRDDCFGRSEMMSMMMSVSSEAVNWKEDAWSANCSSCRSSLLIPLFSAFTASNNIVLLRNGCPNCQPFSLSLYSFNI